MASSDDEIIVRGKGVEAGGRGTRTKTLSSLDASRGGASSCLVSYRPVLRIEGKTAVVTQRLKALARRLARGEYQVVEDALIDDVHFLGAARGRNR